MNKSCFVLIVAYFLAMPSFTYPECGFYSKKNIINNNAQTRKFCASYIASLLLGSGVGVITGGLTAYGENIIMQYMKKNIKIESPLPFWILRFFSWMLESEIRNDIIVGLQSDLDAYQFQYKKSLMLRSGWIASWLAYLKESSILNI